MANRHAKSPPIRTLSALFVIALAACHPAHAVQPAQEVIGQWKFTSVLDGVKIASIDEHQAKQLLGRAMTIQNEGTRFGTESCGAPSFESKRIEPNVYIRQEAQISAAKLRLPNPVTVVDIGCTQVFIKRADEAVIFWDGFFFSAKKIKTSTNVHR
ncbi:hypothetical protein [Massilia timonae]|uniref:hypothetical protein n=1 Tax=Massilia timonae TaxID=47229 RepID=UPI0028D2B238|nr:hypothetical protein [Massilia timonae]